jgi:hypothetical protein
MELADRISRIPALTDEAKEKLVADLTKKLNESTLDEPEDFQTAVQLSMQAASVLERIGDTEQAIAAYTAFAKELDDAQQEHSA